MSTRVSKWPQMLCRMHTNVHRALYRSVHKEPPSITQTTPPAPAAHAAITHSSHAVTQSTPHRTHPCLAATSPALLPRLLHGGFKAGCVNLHAAT